MINFSKIVLVLLFVVSSLNASSVEYDEVYKTYKIGEFKKSLKEFEVLADNGDADAAYILGYMYEHGEGCEVDTKKSTQWYKKSSHTYYQKSKYSVTKSISQNTDDLYETLEPTGDLETDATIYKYMHSIFNLSAHEANYLIPLSYRTNGDYDATTGRNTVPAEVEFQISVKYDFAPNLFGLGEIYSIAYTQHSFWQYFVGDAYFRASDYNPEIFVTIPTNTKYFKAVRLSGAHKSNGMGKPNERSWNYITLSSYFQYKFLFAELQLWHRMGDNYDYNPELIDTMGHGHLKLMVPYKKHYVSTLFRSNFAGKNTIDASYSYPLFGDSLFLYIKGFAGYGESMISYAGNPLDLTHHRDDYVEKIGIGFSLSR